VGARLAEQKKGNDRGIDGRIYFHDDKSGVTKSIILSVKAGRVSPSFVRDLHGVVDREKASIGVLITMETPTKEIRKEAATGEFYVSGWGHTKHPKIQLLTVSDLLSGQGIDRPPEQWTGATFKKAPKAKGKAAEQLRLGD
jgi:site-specific DNA-methyltransferase (adenine-specific)